MKKLMTVLLTVTLLFSIACSNSKVLNGTQYDTYGLANLDSVKSPHVQYRLVVGNLVWSFLLVETIIAPVYFIGWDLYEPVGFLNCNEHYNTSCESKVSH